MRLRGERDKDLRVRVTVTVTVRVRVRVRVKMRVRVTFTDTVRTAEWLGLVLDNAPRTFCKVWTRSTQR